MKPTRWIPKAAHKPREPRRDAAIGAGTGAVIGGLAGGGLGAGIGAAAGGAAGAVGGVIMGKSVEIAPETRFTYRLTQPVVINSHVGS